MTVPLHGRAKRDLREVGERAQSYVDAWDNGGLPKLINQAGHAYAVNSSATGIFIGAYLGQGVSAAEIQEWLRAGGYDITIAEGIMPPSEE